MRKKLIIGAFALLMITGTSLIAIDASNTANLNNEEVTEQVSNEGPASPVTSDNNTCGQREAGDHDKSKVESLNVSAETSVNCPVTKDCPPNACGSPKKTETAHL